MGIVPGMYGCATARIYNTEAENNMVRLPLALFLEKNIVITRIKGEEFDLAVLKKKEGTFDALQMRCTHAENALTYTGNGFICHVHGSTFANTGEVTKGPAEDKLKSYRIEMAGDILIIHI